MMTMLFCKKNKKKEPSGRRWEISADELENMLMAFMGIYAISRVLMKAKWEIFLVLYNDTIHTAASRLQIFKLQ